jgi:hypothetical protein
LPAYVLNGNQIYGTPGVGDPVINQVITSAPIDTDSATILAYQNAAFVLQNGSNATYMRINYVSPAPYPTTYPIATATPGHNPPMSTPCPTGAIVYCGSGAVAYWIPGTYVINGTCHSNCVQDDHWLNWDQSTNIAMEANGGNWNGTTLSAYSGYTDNLNNSYCSQYGNKGDNFSVAGLPGLGAYTFGDDLLAAKNSGTPINHPAMIVAPISGVANGSGGVNISPLTTNSVGSCSGGATTQCFKFGDLLRLKASVTCPGDAIANAVCVQWKTYGAYIAELGAQPGIHYALDQNGTDDTDSALLTWQHSLSATTDWDVIQRNYVHC